MKRVFLALLALFALSTPAAVAQQDSIVGQWAGIGLQIEPAETWTIQLSIQSDGHGRIDYPSLQCGGELTREGRRGEVVFFRERITYGDHCVTNGTVGVYSHAGRLMWFWTGEGSDYPAMAASAVLSRDAPIS
ncbi:MAG: hypothetical protein AB7H66_03020 [Hyphomonadaceae bacterium]